MTFEPSELTQSETRLLRPLMTEEMVMTAEDLALQERVICGAKAAS